MISSYVEIICGQRVGTLQFEFGRQRLNNPTLSKQKLTPFLKIKTLECVCILTNYHSDAVSQVQTFWNESVQCWQTWTGSWDRSLIVWDLGPANKLPSGPFSQSQVSKEFSKDALNQVAKNLEMRTANLQEKRKQLEQRKALLEERKKGLEDKKAQLAKKKAQLQSQV